MEELRQAARLFVQDIAEAKRESQSARRPCINFLVRAWCILKVARGNPNFSRLQKVEPGQPQEIAEGLYESVRKLRKLPNINTADDATLLALLRAADEVLAIVTGGEDYNNFGTNLFFKFEAVKVRVPRGVATDGYGDDFYVIQRRNPLSGTPGQRQRNPIEVCITRHRIIPRRLNNSLNVFVQSPSAGHGFNNMKAPPWVCFAGAYDTARDFPDSRKIGEDGKPVGQVIKIFEPTHGIDEASRLKDIQAHLRKAKKLKATVAVLPELTITPDMPRLIQKWCETENPLDPHFLFVPGTFHIEDARLPADQRRRNRAVLMTGTGAVIHVQDKSQIYTTQEPDKITYEETIDTADTIGICFVGDVGLLLSTCIEFCNQDFAAIDHLDASMVLVPSMGDVSTRNAHVTKCNQLKARGRPNVIIAQSMTEPVEKKPSGWTGIFDGRRVVPKSPGDFKLQRHKKLQSQ